MTREPITIPRPPSIDRSSPRLDELRRGETVFLPGYTSTGWYRKAMVAEGYTVRTQRVEVEGVKGLAVWAEKP